MIDRVLRHYLPSNLSIAADIPITALATGHAHEIEFSFLNDNLMVPDGHLFIFNDVALVEVEPPQGHQKRQSRPPSPASC